MIRTQFRLGLDEELIVDNFAGGGGASTGIERALGRQVDHAINHSREALGMHRINHPQTVHHCADVFEVDPAAVCEGRPVGLAHFSPDCKHFSKAKGGKPLDARIRGLVLVMLRWAKYGCRVMTMENVEEITTWGPLVWVEKGGEMGWYPDPKERGRTWLAFLSILSTGIEVGHPDLPEILEVLGGTVTREECVRGFGYEYEARELRACEYGTPTIRRRLFMVARRDGRPIVFPAASHYNPAKVKGAARKGLKPWRTIAECIDWDLACPSIFLAGEAAKRARCKRPLAAATERRIAVGIDRYVLKAKRPFLVSVTHSGGDRVESVDEPARTVTGAHRGEKGVVCPQISQINADFQRRGQEGETQAVSAAVISRFNGSHAGREDGAERNRSVEDPLSVQDTSNRFGLISASMMVNTTDHTGGPADAPGRTIATGGHHYLVTGTLAPFVTECANASSQRNMPADEPARTTCAQVKGGHFAAVTGTLIGAGGRAAQSRPRGMEEPGHTFTGKADTCLAAASMVKLRGDAETHAPGQPVSEPVHTVSAGGKHHGLVAATIVRQFGQSVGQSPEVPCPTVMAAGGGKIHLAAAYLAQHNAGFNDSPGHAADEPVCTISGTGSQQTVVAGSLAAYYGNDEDGQGVAEPARTVTTKERFGLVESTGVAPMTEEQVAGARRVAAFLRRYGVEFEGEFATVEGFVIVDIGMRMLTPRELFRAQGFGDGYIIDRAWVIDPATGDLTEVRLTKEQQIRMCGNSVCPQVMAALVRANVPELARWEKGEGGGLEIGDLKFETRLRSADCAVARGVR